MTASARLYWLLGAVAVFGLVAGLLPLLMPIWWAAIGVIALGVAVDTLVLWQTPPPIVHREVPNTLPLGVWTEVSLVVENTSRRGMTVDVFDKPPATCEMAGLPATLGIAADERIQVAYEIKPNERGETAFAPADVRLHGPIGLLRRQVEAGPSSTFRVLPNFRAVSRYALLALADRVGDLGIRQIRRRGSGMEFDHLRDYRQGDLTRQIDWKATARRQKLISREYEDERNQHIVFLLDCGRRMRAKDAALTHFDHVLNATLLLSYVALRQGDSVAVATFGGQDLWIPRQRGPRGLNAILDGVYDLQTTRQPSDFSDAARKLVRLQRRRALVVLVTNLYDQVPGELTEAIGLLRRKHLVLVGSLREAATEDMAHGPLHDFGATLQVGAAHHYLEQRARTHRELVQQGMLLLDVAPRDLSVQLINRYLEIKRGGLL